MDESTWTIRPARPEDAQRLVPLWRQMSAAHEQYEPVFFASGNDAEARWQEYCLGLFEKDNPVLLVAEGPAGEPIGYLMGWMETRRSTRRYRRSCFIQAVLVDANHRGRGIAKALMARATEHARAAGAEMMELNVALANTGARALYDNLGFRPATTRMYRPLIEPNEEANR